jgi:hypothetical protein
LGPAARTAKLSRVAERENGMTDKLRYGVFRLGRIWSVVRGDGRAVGFPTRGRAVCAAHTLAAAEQSRGAPAEVVLQDEIGCLTNVQPLGLAVDHGPGPGRPARTYRLYFLNDSGQVVDAVEMACKTDDEVMVRASATDTHRPRELWNLARRVRVYAGAPD